MSTDTSTTLQKAQDFAIGQVLSEWDPALEYDDIIRVLRSDGFEDGEEDAVEQVTPWQPYDNLSGSQVADEIEGMVHHLVKLFGGTK